MASVRVRRDAGCAREAWFAEYFDGGVEGEVARWHGGVGGSWVVVCLVSGGDGGGCDAEVEVCV